MRLSTGCCGSENSVQDPCRKESLRGPPAQSLVTVADAGNSRLHGSRTEILTKANLGILLPTRRPRRRRIQCLWLRGEGAAFPQ